MSHTSQRRGLDPANPGREIIVLAMVPSEHKDRDGVGAAMGELALKLLEHRPHNWLSKNFNQITIPKLGPAQVPVGWMSGVWPEATQRLLMRGVGYLSSVATAVYTDPKKVADLITDLKGEWLKNNEEKDLPISIVLSGLFDDVHECCQKTDTREHTFLHSLGFFGKVEDLPSRDELELITMCGHGLIAANRVRDLTDKIKQGKMSIEGAAENISRPCVCGIVNEERAIEVFRRLAGK
jgi:hypothetical protein